MGVVIIIVLFGIAVFTPEFYFKVLDQRETSQIRLVPKINTEEVVEEDSIVEMLKLGSRLIDNTETRHLMALQKETMSESEFNRLYGEVTKLVKAGLIKSMPLKRLSDDLVYVAYYNILNQNEASSIAPSFSVKEFRFTDYSTYEYAIWMDGTTDKIYEVTMVDNKENLVLSEMAYMNGLRDYYKIDNISPLERSNPNKINYYQTSLEERHWTSYYSEFSIYNASTTKYVLGETGVQWGIFSKPLPQ